MKFQLVISKEKEIKEAVDHFQKLNVLKSVLDSQAILGTNYYSILYYNLSILLLFSLVDVPSLESKLNKIVSHQHIQERKVSKLTHETYELINNYSNFVSQCS